MGGIGKTTLAQKVFNDPLIREYFDIRAWVTVSQTYSLKRIFEQLLKSMNYTMKEGTSEEKLGEHMYKKLMNVRYCIVMDDVWDTVIWDSIKRFFPNDDYGSRIILTTRLESIAIYTDSSMPLHTMGLLGMDVSWDLFRKRVFSEEICPIELEEIGKKIVQSCGGLPLAIVVMGGLFSTVERTEVSWRNVAEDVSLVANTKMEQCSNILSTSYKHLPHSMKACFLYMGAFPEDYEISVSKLTKLWVAEGFFKRYGSKIFEEVAINNLEKLIERNLVFVRKKRADGNIKTCGIHDLLRDFCLREAEKEGSLIVMGDVSSRDYRAMNVHPRMINAKYRNHGCLGVRLHRKFEDFKHCCAPSKPTSVARSILYFNGESSEKFDPFLSVELLRVLDLQKNYLGSLRTKIDDLVNLRFFASIWDTEKIPPLLSKLWNLQTLILSGGFYINKLCARIPLAILDLPHLRHIQLLGYFCLPDVDTRVDEKSFCVLENLQTLSTVSDLKFTMSVITTIPNVKKLGITYFSPYEEKNCSDYCLDNIVHLQKLEELKCYHLSSPDTLQILGFPPSLRVLSLFACDLRWENMTILGSLPNLEVLKIKQVKDVRGDWEPIEGQFCQLKFLLLKETSLEHLKADSTHFPCLKHLIIDRCKDLYEIPCDIGDIPTLETIEIVEAGESLFKSAKKIAEDQRSCGNEELQVYHCGADKWGRKISKVKL